MNTDGYDYLNVDNQRCFFMIRNFENRFFLFTLSDLLETRELSTSIMGSVFS